MDQVGDNQADDSNHVVPIQGLSRRKKRWDFSAFLRMPEMMARGRRFHYAYFFFGFFAFSFLFPFYFLLLDPE
jgi:hypothetical protein